MTQSLKTWEAEEIRRSASEARKIELHSTPFERYLDPPCDAAYPLEYAFHLLGDAKDKVVLDFGCGAGENTTLLARRSEHVIGIDLSPELIAVAAERLRRDGTQADLRVASAYSSELPDGSVDIVFCIALLHHLDLSEARKEVDRILRPGGCVIVSEPVRDSDTVAFIRKMIPFQRGDVSAFERCLKQEDLAEFGRGFQRLSSRRFRIPFIPVVDYLLPRWSHRAWKLDFWLLNHIPWLRRYASVEVTKFAKPVLPAGVGTVSQVPQPN